MPALLCGMSLTSTNVSKSKWVKEISYHADHQKVGRCCTRRVSKEAVKRRPQDRCHQKSKTRIPNGPIIMSSQIKIKIDFQFRYVTYNIDISCVTQYFIYILTHDY